MNSICVFYSGRRSNVRRTKKPWFSWNAGLLCALLCKLHSGLSKCWYCWCVINRVLEFLSCFYFYVSWFQKFSSNVSTRLTKACQTASVLFEVLKVFCSFESVEVAEEVKAEYFSFSKKTFNYFFYMVMQFWWNSTLYECIDIESTWRGCWEVRNVFS